MSAMGALLGLAAGGGLLAVLAWIGARRPRPLADRVSGVLALPGPAVRADPTVRLRDLLIAVLGPSGIGAPRRGRGDGGDLARRLRRAGLADDALGHRLERLAWAGSAAVAGVVVGLLGAPATALAPVLGVMGATVGAWSCDARLRHRARRRLERMAAQLPLLADLTALAVTAGAPPVAALASAGAAVGAPLAEELAEVADRVRAGEPADVALRSLADVLALPGLHRLVDSLLVAVEHGTPLAGVARAQADDLRADERRRLMESAGRRDIAMLVPIVVLVLPSVLLVALYPGLQALRLVVP